MSEHATITPRMQALFFMNGLGLFVAGILFGWAWFFHLLQEIVLWPLPVQIDVQIPGDSRAFRMGHMEAITQGLLLMALAFGGQFMRPDQNRIPMVVLDRPSYCLAVYLTGNGKHFFWNAWFSIWRRTLQREPC